MTTAVANGQVSQATIDDHVRHILTPMFRRGLFDRTQTGTPQTTVTSAAHRAVAREVAAAGSVLLKNANAVLPLAAGASVAVVGPGGDRAPMYQGGGSAEVDSSNPVSPYQAIRARLGAAATYSFGSDTGPITGVGGKCIDVDGSSTNNNTPIQIYDCNSSPAQVWTASSDGTLRALGKCMEAAGGNTAEGTKIQLYDCNNTAAQHWTIDGATIRHPASGRCLDVPGGTSTNKTVLQLYACNSSSAQQWNVPMSPNGRAQAVAAARSASVAVVVVDKWSAEGSDLDDLNLSAAQNQLVSEVAAANPNTVVVVNTGSAVTMPWANAVRGIIAAWYPGQEYGNALASVLFGDVNPSGRLPVTFPAALSDVPARTAAQWPGQNGTVQYSEDIHVGYRWYDRQNITPLYPFGFGLSYTTFGYANLAVGQPDAAGNVAVSFDVTNTGSRAGAEVAQVYVGHPASTGEPPQNLRGFTKVALNPGQTQRVTLSLDERSFQHWTNAGWTTPAGSYPIMVGASSRGIRLTGAATIRANGPVVGLGNLCMDVRARHGADGTPVQTYTCNESPAQTWTVRPGGALVALDKCLDVAGAGTADGTLVQLYRCSTGNAAQVWQRRSDGTLINPNSGRCLEASDAGVQLTIRACTAAANQRWTLPG
ncbi:glycoside hydrolase family 3 C-terminal domain-containing protein [Micromonosporaceae bacterium Da 78-11]